MNGNIGRESLVKLADSIIDREDEVVIKTLSDELTISQVVRFFERQGRSFTKTMIQNYVRVGVLPPPVDKRYYTRNHLVLLTLIDSLKSVYSLELIRDLLAPVRNNPEIFEDDIIEITDIYKNYLTMSKESVTRWKESLPNLFDHVDRLLDNDGVQDNEKRTAAPFLIALTIMADTIVMKELVSNIISKYISKEKK